MARDNRKACSSGGIAGFITNKNKRSQEKCSARIPAKGKRLLSSGMGKGGAGSGVMRGSDVSPKTGQRHATDIIRGETGKEYAESIGDKSYYGNGDDPVTVLRNEIQHWRMNEMLTSRTEERLSGSGSGSDPRSCSYGASGETIKREPSPDDARKVVTSRTDLPAARKERDALEYLDLCVEPEIRLLASSESRMRSHSRSACECYCKTRVPMAKQREEILRGKRSGGGKDGDSKSSLGKTETARSTRKASLISTSIAHRRQPDSKRSTATPAASPFLSPETSAAIEDVEKLMINAEIQMREIRVASDRSRLKKRANLYLNEAPLEDEADQLLYIRERVARKFDEANSNGCWMDPDPGYPRKSFQQRSCNEETSAAIESKRIVDFSAARFKSSDDPYEEFSQQRRRDLERFGLSSTEIKKSDEETRKGNADVPRTGKLETRSVQAGPSVNIKGELRMQNLDNVHISPDSSFAEEAQNVATYVVRRDFEKRNESPRRRREKIVKISENRASNGISINRKIAKDRGSGLQNSEEVSREELANLLLAESKEKSVENAGRIGEEEKESILKEKPEKCLEENGGGSVKGVDANQANGNEETSTKADKNSMGEGKQVRFDSFATQTDATSAESLNEAAKVQRRSIESSSLSKETKAEGEQTEERYANVKNGRGGIGERCETGTGREKRYEKIGESFANVVAKYCKNGDDCHESLNVTNASGNSQSFEDSKDVETAKRSRDSEDSKNAKDSKNSEASKNAKDSKYPKYSKDSNDLQNSETAKDSKCLKDSKDSKASKDVEYFKDSEDSQSSTDDLSNFYEPALTELDNILITYDKMIDDVARSTGRVDEFLSRPEMEEYRQRSAASKPINAKSKRRDARKIEATKIDSLIKPPIERRVKSSAARDANASTRKDKRTNGCEFAKTKTSPVKRNNDSKAERGGAMDPLGFARNPRRSSKTTEERWKKEESASEWSENRTRDEKLMRIAGMEETRSLENANWKHDSSSCIASSKSRISSGKEDWELGEKEKGAVRMQEWKKESEARIEKGDPIGWILREESRLVEDEVKRLFNADEMVAVVVKSVLENFKSDAAPDDFESFIRRRASVNFPSIDETIEKKESQGGEETLSATETQKCDDEETGEKSWRVSEKSDRREESIAGSEDRSRSKGEESVDLRDSPLESFRAKGNGDLQTKEDAGESLACANAVSKVEDKVEDAEERVGEVLRANDGNEDDDNETASNAKSEKSAYTRSEDVANARSDNTANATRPDKTPSKVSTENGSNVESKGEGKGNETDGPTMDDHLSSDSLRDCASLGSCSRNVSKEQLDKQTLEIADGESLTSNVAFERERILADVYDEVNKNLFSSARITNRTASDRINQDRFSSGVSTVERNKVEISSESSHSEGELYGASSGSYSVGEIRMLSKSRSDGETTDFDDNIGAFVTKRMLASWNESSKSLVQSMGEI